MADIFIALGVGLTLGMLIGTFLGVCLTALAAMNGEDDDEN